MIRDWRLGKRRRVADWDVMVKRNAQCDGSWRKPFRSAKDGAPRRQTRLPQRLKHSGMIEFQARGESLPNVLIHKANELKPQTRAAVEAELGRALSDDEDVSIMAFPLHDAPAGEARREAAQKLATHLERIDSQTANASDKEAEAALNEALKSVRPGYRERE